MLAVLITNLKPALLFALVGALGLQGHLNRHVTVHDDDLSVARDSR